MCCSRTISPKPAQCCGSASYNPNTHTCCGGKVLSTAGISSPGCCGSTVYDRNQKVNRFCKTYFEKLLDRSRRALRWCLGSVEFLFWISVYFNKYFTNKVCAKMIYLMEYIAAACVVTLLFTPGALWVFSLKFSSQKHRMVTPVSARNKPVQFHLLFYNWYWCNLALKVCLGSFKAAASRRC